MTKWRNTVASSGQYIFWDWVKRGGGRGYVNDKVAAKHFLHPISPYSYDFVAHRSNALRGKHALQLIHIEKAHTCRFFIWLCSILCLSYTTLISRMYWVLKAGGADKTPLKNWKRQLPYRRSTLYLTKFLALSTRRGWKVGSTIRT